MVAVNAPASPVAMARRGAHDMRGRGALGADVVGSDVVMPAGIKQLLDAENKATDQVQEARKSEYPRLFCVNSLIARPRRDARGRGRGRGRG